MTYTKNEKSLKLQNSTEKVSLTNTYHKNKETITNATVNDNKDDQMKITEFFIRNIRKESDMKDTNESEILNTQEMINDARERRSLAINGKSKIMDCDQCEFETTSKTLLNKHLETTHQNQQAEQGQEMRKRHQCDKCGYRTTSKDVLIRHNETTHKANKAANSKRKVCNQCGKKFNKNSTFNNHMQQAHDGGKAKNIGENIELNNIQ